ncbi:hypothetical protein B0H13DRAFT_1911917 [Mycena leptocephala]|nr:hypothetical protein B0H13DRAFT_1911917 [Mycena leptocephala]
MPQSSLSAAPHVTRAHAVIICAVLRPGFLERLSMAATVSLGTYQLLQSLRQLPTRQDQLAASRSVLRQIAEFGGLGVWVGGFEFGLEARVRVDLYSYQENVH